MELNSSHSVQRFPLALNDARHGKTFYASPWLEERRKPLLQRTMRRVVLPLVHPVCLEKGRLIDLYA
jgi:hypothetical protein